uniref:Uncharacterized protein n=1 Tax=Oryza glumipatula TaxID=40148 RepID=A0A0D9YGJ3_9ORYZ
MASSSLTTSAMDGLASVSSLQHLTASEANLATHSGELEEDIRSSITPAISPDWCSGTYWGPLNNGGDMSWHGSIDIRYWRKP